MKVRFSVIGNGFSKVPKIFLLLVLHTVSSLAPVPLPLDNIIHSRLSQGPLFFSKPLETRLMCNSIYSFRVSFFCVMIFQYLFCSTYHDMLTPLKLELEKPIPRSSFDDLPFLFWHGLNLILSTIPNHFTRSPPYMTLNEKKKASMPADVPLT